jgi:hypothetical protein
MKTILHFILFSILLSISQFAFGQVPGLQWAKQTGTGAADDQCSAIAVDAAGNVYTTGFFNGTIDFNPGSGTFNLTSTGSTDVFVSKLDASGNFVWAKKIGGSNFDYGNSIALDVSGNVYITGHFSSTPDFDPGTGTYTMTSAGQTDIFVCKLSNAGNFIWAKQMGGTSNDQGHDVTTDAAGNVYTTGWYQTTADFDPGASTYTLGSPGGREIFISKLDANGNFAMARSFEGAGDGGGKSIVIDPSGNIYTSGQFWFTTDFDPGPGTFTMVPGGSTSDIFITKLDPAGNLLWAKKMGGSNQDYPYGMAVDINGNVLTTGEFYATADFDPGTAAYTFTSTGFGDIFISKLDASGNFVWAKHMPGVGLTSGDAGKDIATDVNGNVYLSGIFTATIDADPGAGTYTLVSAGGSDLFIAKLDAGGNLVWVGQMGGTNTGQANSMALDAAGNIYSAGSFAGTSDFDPGASTFNMTASSSGFDGYVVKLGSSATSVELLYEKASEVSVYPNPASEKFTLTGPFNAESFVEITDLSGRLILSENLGGNDTELNVSGLCNGVYLINVFEKKGSKSKTARLIVSNR